LTSWHDCESAPLAIWRSGDLAIWRSGDLAIWRSGDLAIWRSGDLAIWRSGLRSRATVHKKRLPGQGTLRS
jgi:hypothetical protein